MENHYSVRNRAMLRFRPSLLPEISGAAKYGRRTKRKYVRVRGRQSAKTRPPQGKSGIDDGTPPERTVVTLQLLPDRSESEKSCCYSSIAPKLKDMIDPDGHRFGDEVRYKTDLTAATWIVVEYVTDTSVDGLGYSDEEILKHLLSGLRIGRRQQRGLGKESGVLVREKLPYLTPCFACRVRMVQQTKHGQKWNKIVACDVWKMEFAWKLDVQTALSLGV